MARPTLSIRNTAAWLGPRISAAWHRVRRSRALHRTMLISGALLLLAYVYQFARCAQLASTGDPLFDRYARAVRDRSAWRLFHGAVPAVLPDLLLASWEGDFGDDPCYWELRYWCATAEPNRSAPRDNPEALGIIAAARRRNAADSDLIWFRWQAETSRMRREQADAEYQRKSGSLDGAAMLEQYDREELKLLDELVAAGQGNAWSYFSRARKHMELGEDEAALSDLKAGNVAKEVGSPRCFPASKVYEMAWQGAPAGSAALSGAVLRIEQQRAIPNYLRLKECAKESLLFAGLGGDSEMATQWFRAGCRLGTDAVSNDIAGLAGRSMADMINAYYLAELSADLSHEQLMGLLAVDEALDEARDLNRSFSGTLEYDYPGLRLAAWLSSRRHNGVSSEDRRNWTSLFKTPGQRIEAWLDWKQSALLPAGCYEQIFQQHSAEAVYRREKLAVLQLQLFDFDYADMQRPPGWPQDGPSLEAQP